MPLNHYVANVLVAQEDGHFPTFARTLFKYATSTDAATAYFNSQIDESKGEFVSSVMDVTHA